VSSIANFPFAGVIRAWGGTAPTASGYGAAGTIYIQTGSGSSLYRKLIVDNNNYGTVEAQRTVLSNTVDGGLTLNYTLDEISIVRKGNFAILPVDTQPYYRTVLSVQSFTGDGTGIIQALPYTQINVVSAPNSSVLSGVSNTVNSADDFRVYEQTTVNYMSGPYVLSAAAVYVQVLGRVVFPANLAVSNVFVRCAGDLFGISFLSLQGSGSMNILSSGRTSLSFTRNQYQFQSISMSGTSLLTVTHDKALASSLQLIAETSFNMVGSSTVTTIGIVQIQTPNLFLNSTLNVISASAGGFEYNMGTSMSSIGCPQVGNGYHGIF
jgi:hypothetical protein